MLFMFGVRIVSFLQNTSVKSRVYLGYFFIAWHFCLYGCLKLADVDDSQVSDQQYATEHARCDYHLPA